MSERGFELTTIGPEFNALDHSATPEENFFDDDLEALIQNLDDDESIEEALDDISTNDKYII